MPFVSIVFFAANIALLYLISSRRWPPGARIIVGSFVPIICLVATLAPNLPDDWRAFLREPLSEFSHEPFDETVIYAIYLLLFYAACTFIPIRAVSVILKKLPSHSLARFENLNAAAKIFLAIPEFDSLQLHWLFAPASAMRSFPFL